MLLYHLINRTAKIAETRIILDLFTCILTNIEGTYTKHEEQTVYNVYIFSQLEHYI